MRVIFHVFLHVSAELVTKKSVIPGAHGVFCAHMWELGSFRLEGGQLTWNSNVFECLNRELLHFGLILYFFRGALNGKVRYPWSSWCVLHKHVQARIFEK